LHAILEIAEDGALHREAHIAWMKTVAGVGPLFVGIFIFTYHEAPYLGLTHIVGDIPAILDTVCLTR
jgi:hypothetical protein